jgi:hypothetical protein
MFEVSGYSISHEFPPLEHRMPEKQDSKSEIEGSS